METKQILESVQLPTLSKTLLEIIEVEKKNPITFLDDIKRIVEKDPMLSAHILKVANSPLYGFSQKVRAISHAVGLLGIRKIKNMAFAFSIFDFLKKLDYKPLYGGIFNLILKKSLLISSCSTILAKKVNSLNEEELYVSGLLTEIGELILFFHSPEKYSKIYSISDQHLIRQEKELFDTDHVKLGVEFCTLNSLPGFFKTAIENHCNLQENDEQSKIAFISNQIAELLLIQDEEQKKIIFKDLENHTKRLLHLSLTEIEETVKRLPDVLEAFIADFPEVQKDLYSVIKAGSTMIVELMKKEMEMLILTQELTESQKKLAREKMFLSHMLNLSYFLSSLISPLRIISSLFEYFENFINEFTIEFIYRQPETGNFVLIPNRSLLEGVPINIDKFSSLTKSKISNEVVQMEKKEMERLEKPPNLTSLIFPISYHHNFFGFLVLNVEKENYYIFDMEMSYVQILSNIIANSFQNYLSFEGLQNESNKKKFVTNELFRFDKELNQSREILIQLQKTEIINELLPVVFHKLKNKLTPILGYSQILMTKVQDPPILDRIQKIEKNTNELATQMNMLKEYYSPPKIMKEKENLNQTIMHLKSYFNEVQDKHDITVKLELDHGIPDDLLNAGQIELLITNLIDNAVTAIKKKKNGQGLITIRTQSQKEGYSLIVHDNGTGIDEESIPSIWAPFFTTSTVQVGLGLTVCERVIANHSAFAEVTSREGEFTEFKISFKNLLLKERESFEYAPLKNPSLLGKILIIDDEAYLLDLMKEILMNEGNFDVTTTTSGKEALQMLRSNFDLVISDIRMPGVDGMDIYDYLKSKKMESRVLMVTADPYSEDVSEFLKKSKVEYIKKPFELMRFKQIVLEKLTLI